ncbi:MAG: general secretion pathway protein GspK [Planctomycetes bacterium]|nr:general secretion pathway protein GspK [Planctomycetota bacterium]
MKNKHPNNTVNYQSQRGIVLLVTLVLLVVLSTLGYTLSNRVAAQRHRDRYIVDYAVARYSCDSAVKYALATLEDMTPQLIDRPNEPDFSDLFAISEIEYQQLLKDWAEGKEFHQAEISYDVNNVNDVNGISDTNDISFAPALDDPNFQRIRGPYGPDWPLVAKPMEFEIGNAKVTIEIEDENAKYPLGWAMIDDKKTKREARVSLETFLEWMDVNDIHVDTLKDQLEEISKIKPYQLEFRAIRLSERRMGTTRGPRGRPRTRRVREARKIPASVHLTDFAKLFHTSLIDAETLAKPTIVSESRRESPLKYMAMWGSAKVNINTAPRHVLEAAFTFGGDADKIAEEIIQRRRVQPFKDIDDLRQSLLEYSGEIEKCEKYITTISTIFTVRITAISGMAKVSAVAAIIKDGKKIERIALISL